MEKNTCMNRFAGYQKLTQHCKSTVLPFFKSLQFLTAVLAFLHKAKFQPHLQDNLITKLPL